MYKKMGFYTNAIQQTGRKQEKRCGKLERTNDKSKKVKKTKKELLVY